MSLLYTRQILYRLTFRCLHLRLNCMFLPRSAICSIVNFLSNQKAYILSIQSQFTGRSYKKGQVVGSYPHSTSIVTISLFYYLLFCYFLNLSPFLKVNSISLFLSCFFAIKLNSHICIICDIYRLSHSSFNIKSLNP